MTPRQRRIHLKALEAAAAAPRKSWLGRFTPLTSTQSAWIKSLLTVWGECVGGKTREQHRMEGCGQFWESMKEGEWSDEHMARITEALKQARDEGFAGPLAIKRAYAILWPVTLMEIMERAEKKDDADFMESVILGALKTEDPVYVVGRDYYTTRKKISDIARELQLIAPWLTPDKARERVKWSLQIFRAKVFLSAKKMLVD